MGLIRTAECGAASPAHAAPGAAADAGFCLHGGDGC